MANKRIQIDSLDLTSYFVRGINAHTATAPQGARYTQLEVSHRPQAGGHRTPSP